MKGKLYKYDPEQGKMVEIAQGQFEFTLPAVLAAKNSVMHAMESLEADFVCSGTVHEIETNGLKLTPKDLLKKAFEIADKEAETLDRRACIDRQALLEEMRNHFLENDIN